MAWAEDMRLNPEIIKTFADVTFKSASKLENRQKHAKKIKEGLRLAKEYARRREMAKKIEEREVVE